MFQLQGGQDDEPRLGARAGALGVNSGEVNSGGAKSGGAKSAGAKSGGDSHGAVLCLAAVLGCGPVPRTYRPSAVTGNTCR